MASVIRATAFALILMATTAFAAEYLDRVAAVVNGDMITLYDLNERVKGYMRSEDGGRYNSADPRIYADLRDKMLQMMIDDLLITQEAKRLKINVSDADIERELQTMMRRNNLTAAQFEGQLAKEGISRKEFTDFMRRDITKQQILSYMVQRKVLVTQDEVKSAGGNPGAAIEAASPQPQTVTVEGVRLGLIILPKAEAAKDVRKKIVSKEISFADAARRFSVGPAKDAGGSLGFIAFKDMSPDLLAASKGLSPGAVSEMVMLDGKPALITVSEIVKETAAAPSASAARGPMPTSSDGVYERLYKAKAEKQFQDYMNKLRSRAIIEIKL